MSGGEGGEKSERKYGKIEMYPESMEPGADAITFEVGHTVGSHPRVRIL